MRLAGEAVGRRGALALSMAGLAATVLALHGYANPGSLGIAGSGLVSPSPGGQPSARASGSAKGNPSPAATPASSPSASPTATPAASASASLGPLLSSTPYAAYTYRIYPGTPSASTRQALAGFSFTARLVAKSVDFTLFESGSTQPTENKTYPASDHIYFVEASLGDDSGNAEYNFGDDGVVVTNTSGHVVQ
jgi:hypothetical protein